MTVSSSYVSSSLQRLFALLPIAWAKLIGLQSIKNPQDFFRITADIHIGHHRKANDAVGIDYERGALGDTVPRVENPKP